MRIKLLILWTLFSINVAAQNVWTDIAADYQIYDIAVDGDIVWSASHGGLIKTNINNGEKEIFQSHNSILKESWIEQVELADDGSLWLSTKLTGLYHIKDGIWKHYPEIVQGEYNNVSKIETRQNGDVWLALTTGGCSVCLKLFRLRNGAFIEFDKIPVFDTNKTFRSFTIKDDNTIYVKASNDFIYEYDVLNNTINALHKNNLPANFIKDAYNIATDKNGKLVLSKIESTYRLDGNIWTKILDYGVTVLSTIKDKDKNLYLISYLQNDIRCLIYDGQNFTTLIMPPSLPNFENKNFILKAVDNKARLFGTNYSPVYTDPVVQYIDAGSWKPLDTKILPLSSNSVEDVVSDCKNNVWFGGWFEGLDVYSTNGTWEHISTYEQDSSSKFSVSDIEVDPTNCSIWTCCSGSSAASNCVMNIKDGIIKSHLKGDLYIIDLEVDKNGVVYVSENKNGLGVYKNNEWKWYPYTQTGFAYKIQIDDNDNVYIAGGSRGLIKVNNGFSTNLGFTNIPGATKVFHVYYDNEGFLWVVTDKGLAQFNGATWTRFDHIYGEDSSISDIKQDRYGNFWISTYDDGLHYWDKKSVFKYKMENSGISTNRITNIDLAKDGYIWLTTWTHYPIRYLKGYDVNVYNARGTVYFDKDKSGTRNLNEIGIPNQKVELVENANISITNGQGDYTHYIPYDDSYNFKLYGQELFYSTTTDHLTALITQNTNGLDFGVFSDQLPEKVELYLNSTPIICESDFNLYATIINESLQPIIGKLNIHSNIEYDSSNIWFHLWHQNNLAFPLDTILPLSTKSYTLRMIGPSIDSVGQKVLISGSFMTNNQTVNAKIEETLLCSYDPNDKLAYPTGIYDKETSLIKDDIRYVIRFQNEGNYFAKDIIILDTLDQCFDLSTFKFTGSSHPCDVNITRNGVVSFIFKDIKLTYKDDDEIASQGYVSYTIKVKADTPENSILQNKAHIFFDANDGIVTNTTQNKVVEMFLSQTEDNSISKVISIFPNPSFYLITVTINENIDEINIRDISGRMMFVDIDVKNQNQAKLDISAYSNGMYIIELIDVFGNRYLSKFIKI